MALSAMSKDLKAYSVGKVMPCMVQEGDPYPQWPDNAEVPESQSEVEFRLAAAKTIKGHSTRILKRNSTLQEGDPYPEWPDDAEVPESESEVQFRLAAAETIKGRGNELFKEVRRNPFGASHA